MTVQRLLGDSLVIDMLGEPEMQTLRESLKDTEHKEALDNKAENVLAFYASKLRNDGVTVKTVMRDGPPAEEDTEGCPGGACRPHHYRAQLQEFHSAAHQGIGDEGDQEKRTGSVPGCKRWGMPGAVNGARLA